MNRMHSRIFSLDTSSTLKNVKMSPATLTAFLLLVLPTCLQAQDFEYQLTTGTVTIIRYTGLPGNVTVPSTNNGHAVTRIGDRAFSGTYVTSVTIPNSVSSIGTEAFNSCQSLTNVMLPNSLARIDDRAFFSCSRLTRVTLPNSLTYIGAGAFYDSGLYTVAIPYSVSSIGTAAFARCGNLSTITVGALNPFYSGADGVLFNKNQTVLLSIRVTNPQARSLTPSLLLATRRSKAVGG